MLYALTTTDSNRQLEYVERSRSADARVTTIARRLFTAGDGGETRALVAGLERAWTAYLRGRDEVIASILEGQVPEAVGRDLSEGAPAFERVRAALGAIENASAAQRAEADSRRSASLSTRSLIRVVGVLCVMQVLALVVLRMVQRASVLGTVQRSDARLRDIVSSINEGMFVAGPDGRVESWNAAAERATGVSRASAARASGSMRRCRRSPPPWPRPRPGPARRRTTDLDARDRAGRRRRRAGLRAARLPVRRGRNRLFHRRHRPQPPRGASCATRATRPRPPPGPRANSSPA